MKPKDAKKEFARQRAGAIASMTDSPLLPHKKVFGGKRCSVQGVSIAGLLKRSPSQDSISMGAEKIPTTQPSSSSSSSSGIDADEIASSAGGEPPKTSCPSSN